MTGIKIVIIIAFSLFVSLVIGPLAKSYINPIMYGVGFNSEDAWIIPFITIILIVGWIVEKIYRRYYLRFHRM